MTITDHPTRDLSPVVGSPEGAGVDEPGLELRTERPAPRPPISVVTVSLTVLAVLLLSFVIDITLVGRLEHRAAQQAAFDRFRSELANGIAPLGPTNWTGPQTKGNGRLLALGTPMALLSIPAIHLQQVVEEGTTGRVLMNGPGHRRDTPFPGQGGTSLILGRQGAFGGPFGQIHALHKGALITVTTQDGVAKFKVTGVRQAGAAEPPALTAGHGRLTLETATGSDYMPTGVLYVDADQTSPLLGAAPSGVRLGSLPADERAMAADTSTLWALVLWLEAVLVIAIGAVWSWHRWGRPQTWLVFFPLLALVGCFCAQQVAVLLPNLM